MKEGIHTDYHKVLFVDAATGKEWVSRSTISSKETREVEGEEIPVVRLDIS
jgi:large subunit ribosomal protein L31